MSSIILTAARIIRDFLISIFLWTYAGLVVLTWHVAYRTPDWAVLLRVAASVLNDLVWLPFGIIVWTSAALVFIRVIRRGKTVPLPISSIVFVAAFIFPLLFPDTAFRLLLLALLISAGAMAFDLLNGRESLHLIGRIVPLALIAMLLIGHYRHQMIPHGKTKVSGIPLKIMSYNILLDDGLRDRVNEIETILAENPDVVCCIEFNVVGDRALFDRELGSLYPYALPSDTPKNSRNGAIVYSKYPVRRAILPDSDPWSSGWGGRLSVIFAELDVKGRKVNLVNYHLKSVGHYIEYIADKKRFTLSEKMIWAAKYEKVNDREKFIQAVSLVKTVAAFRGPTILCGDLNDTPNSRAFHTVLKKFRNTFSEKGWGLGATFGERRIGGKLSRIPFGTLLDRDMLRIDHIFVSRDIGVVASTVRDDATGSDHKPIVSIVDIP
jgi:endonuclease/exonuclease/phosphatase (EEP) superfamily protein YafD